MALRRISAGRLKGATLAGATLAVAWFGGVVLGMHSLRNTDSVALEASLSALPSAVSSVMWADASDSAETEQQAAGLEGSANLSVGNGVAGSVATDMENSGKGPAAGAPAPSAVPDDRSDFGQSGSLAGPGKGARLSSRLSWSRARFKASPKPGFHNARLCLISVPCGIERQQQVVMRRKGGDEPGAPPVIGVGF